MTSKNIQIVTIEMIIAIDLLALAPTNLHEVYNKYNHCSFQQVFLQCGKTSAISAKEAPFIAR